MAKVDRPLSPHLQVYKWRVHMFTSIMHRATGSALAVGALIMTWFLVALAEGSAAFDTFMTCMSSPLGKLVLIGMTFALMQHLASGIRHLIMDTGKLYELKANTSSANLTYVFSILTTALIWLFGYGLI
ncbi:succinate dehydrogenase, cytochrome b556 subunit [Temperatibacter marinus]|uniref:Succinate dehydrogenase cytochrome b556 subunit n=1 Tax=Temperatibacter marinus TaxID=1456591 RepID=A0AA52EEU3_9PROT|nr:succinate dehydrogenase, cytochrome b556 subunit [Temperatibacter marinus]WND01510.1 succinate dehydrogenase, cytochrome b556 subunit [Temperatibacter marinus]